MIDNFNILTNSSTCDTGNTCYRTDEPTYINETQLLYFNNDILNLCQRTEFSGNRNEHDQTMRYVISQSNDSCDKGRSSKEVNAAITIQRAFRSFKRRSKHSIPFGGDQDETNNYIEFWDDCEANRRSGYSLATTSNSASDSKNSDFDNTDADSSHLHQHHDDDDGDQEHGYHNDHIYDSIPYDLSSPSPPDSPNKGVIVRESQSDHHSQCPLSKQRKHSIDINRLTRPNMFAHRYSDQTSPHSVVVYEEDLRKVNSNLYVVRSTDKQQPVVMTINKSCPTHNHHQNNYLICHNYPKIVSINSNIAPYVEYSPDERTRQNLIRKQSKIIQNQKIVTAKRMYRIGLNIFNKNPAAGINYLIKYQYIKAHPSHIAKFLLTKSGISRNAIGDYIGSISDPLALQVTKFFLRRINMKNKEVDEALRSFIYYVHLPGESQKICHLMEEFKVAYMQQNESRSKFKSHDTIMVLAYAIIMLQTDAHNQSIRKSDKMTLEQFVTNLRGVDDNSNIDRTILEHIYTRVTGKEIKTMPDHTDQVRRLNDVISGGNKPPDLVNRIRRFMCYCRLSEIVDDAKKNKSDAHQREVFLFNDHLLITKLHNKSRKEDVQYQCKYGLALTDLRVKVFSSTNYPFGIHLFERKTNDSIIKLNAQCEEDQKKFMFDLSDCIFESLEMLKINYSDYASLSPSQTQSSPKASPSNLASKCPSTFCHKMDSSIPNPPRRQESLVRNDHPDGIPSQYRVRNQSLTEGESSRLTNYNGKPHSNDFYS